MPWNAATVSGLFIFNMSHVIGDKWWYLDDAEPENYRFTSEEWHKKYKFECFKMFDFTCVQCHKIINTSQGVVHHYTYKHKCSIYQARPEELWGKICVMCYECHKREHQQFSIDGITRILPEITIDNLCKSCGFEVQELDSDGNCEVCKNMINRDLNEYLF